MISVDALVAELLAKLIDTVEAANDELLRVDIVCQWRYRSEENKILTQMNLEVQLRRNPELHIHVDRVTTREKRAGVGAASLDGKDGSLDLEEAA